MVSCTACGTTRNTKNLENGVTWHKFPTNATRRAVWLENMSISPLLIVKSSRLCSKHFSDDCFDRTSLMKVRLFSTAVPTITIHSTTRNDTIKQETNVSTCTQEPPIPSTSPSDSSTCVFLPITLTLLASPDLTVFPPASPTSTESTDLFNLISPCGSSSSSIISSISTNNEPAIDPLFIETCNDGTVRNLKRKFENVLHNKNKEIKKLQQKVYLQKRKVGCMKLVLLELKRKMMLNEETANLLLTTYGSDQDVINRLFKKTHKKNANNEYEQPVKSFAVTLNFFSPKAYDYVRNKFENCLPLPKTLSKWYSSIDAKPGFTSEAFEFLKKKVAATDKNLCFSLVFDEMAIRQQVQSDGSKYHGYVEFGNQVDHGDCIDLAKEALVFMIVCINEEWKMPIGYFFIADINSEQKASLLKQCLTLLKEAGVIITNITFDGCPINLTMCTLLGCDFDILNFKTFFIYNETKYFVLPDPAHTCKLIRNCFEEQKVLLNINKEKISFHYLQELNNLQENEGFHLGNKLRKQHFNIFKQKIEVQLTTELLNKSLADSLSFCKDELKLKKFEDCGATIAFINIMNDAFDILNSHQGNQCGFKKAACQANIETIRIFYIKLKNYIINLKMIDKTPLLQSNRKTGFLGLLIGMQTLLNMFELFILEANHLQCLPMDKCNQDHIELFFGAVRSQEGYNNNPNCRQFTTAYKKILIDAEVLEGGAGNCIPLEEIHILNITSSKKPAVQIIKESVRSDDIPDESNEKFDTILIDHQYACKH